MWYVVYYLYIVCCQLVLINAACLVKFNPPKNDIFFILIKYIYLQDNNTVSRLKCTLTFNKLNEDYYCQEIILHFI